MRKVSSAADFMCSDTPLEILGTITAISFDGSSCVAIEEDALTAEEVGFCLFLFRFVPLIVKSVANLSILRSNIYVMICVFLGRKILSIY